MFCRTVVRYVQKELKSTWIGRIDMYLVNLPCFADRNFLRKAAKSELGIICCLLMPLTDKDCKFEHCLKSGLTKIILLLFCTQLAGKAIKEFTLILRRNKAKH